MAENKGDGKILWDALNRTFVVIVSDEDGTRCFGIFPDRWSAYKAFIEDYVLDREDFSDSFCDDSMEDFRDALERENWMECKRIYDEGRNWSVPYVKLDVMELDED